MIQTKELRIGNNIEFDGEIITVTGISKNKITYNPSKVLKYEINAKHFDPIPLTEEILLKFGFEDQEFSDEDGNKIYMLHHKKFYLTSDESCMFSEVFLPIYSNDCVSVKYVHQLQNLYLALTGKELPQVSDGKK